MAELQWPDAVDMLPGSHRCLVRKDLADGALGIAERNHLRDAGRRVVADLAAHAFVFQACTDVTKLGVGTGLKRQSGAARLFALLELHREVAQPGNQESAPVYALRQYQARRFGEVVDLPVDVRRLEGSMSETPDLDHE